MITQTFMVSSALKARTGAAPEHGPAHQVSQLPREQWIGLCQARLRELGVNNRDPAATLVLASELWNDVAMFDPCIAAELEYESGMSDA